MQYLMFLIALFVAATAVRADIQPGSQWEVKGEFKKDKDARKNLSGAACVFPVGHCLAVNDEKKYAQFFDIDGTTLLPGKLIRLLPKGTGDEIDAEGIAYQPPTNEDGQQKDNRLGHFYVTGSHGLSRHAATFDAAAFLLFRFPVDPKTGKPTFEFDDDEDAASQIKKTALLRDTLRAQPDLSPYAERRLDQCGVNIEGMAVLGTDMLFGLRAPSVKGNAYILRVALADLFKPSVPPGRMASLALGPGVGIRDLARVSNGVLTLGGRSLGEKPADGAPSECIEPKDIPRPAVWFWSGNDGDKPEFLGDLPGIDPEMKAETLLVLKEEEAPSKYRVLVLFDGEKNGKPMEFVISKTFR